LQDPGQESAAAGVLRQADRLEQGRRRRGRSPQDRADRELRADPVRDLRKAHHRSCPEHVEVCVVFRVWVDDPFGGGGGGVDSKHDSVVDLFAAAGDRGDEAGGGDECVCAVAVHVGGDVDGAFGGGGCVGDAGGV